MNKDRIYYTKPSITELEVSYATDATRNGWGDKCYDYVKRFEGAFKEHLGVKHAISTSSCTGSLQMGLAALDIGPGDEVILADTNWIATVAPIVHLGATPVFVDILEDTWCINPQKVREAITPKTKAIIATHIYGNLCDMNSLMAIGKMHEIIIIEDAAEAIGSVYFNKNAGSIGNFGTFSFHGTKTITTGEGGMFVTNEDDLFDRVVTLSNHGRSRKQIKQFWPNIIGYKFKLSNVQAAIGVGQLERIEELVNRKREILSYYKKAFRNLKCIKMNPEPDGIINGAWMPTIIFDNNSNITREKIQTAFHVENIDARVFFYPLSSLPMFTDCQQNVIAWNLPNRSINIPSYHDLTDAQLQRICDVIINIAEASNE